MVGSKSCPRRSLKNYFLKFFEKQTDVSERKKTFKRFHSMQSINVKKTILDNLRKPNDLCEKATETVF